MERAVSLFLFGFLLTSFAYFYQSGEHNENARFDQIRSVLEEGRLSINTYSFNTADIITINGLSYPNKPPGLTFVAIPGWWIAERLVSYINTDREVELHLTCYLATLLVVGVAGAAGGVLMFKYLYRSGYDLPSSLLLAIGLSFATIAFPYSTLLFSHVVTATLLFAAFYLLSEKRWPIISGLLSGAALCCEYPAALAIGMFGLYIIITDRRVSTRLPLFGFGNIVPIALLLSYNFDVLGNPFAVTYSVYAENQNSPFPAHRLGFSGVRLPDLETLLAITFGKERGLFLFNPWLILFFPALLLFKYTRDRLLCLAIVIAFFAFNAGYGDSIVYWGGGHSTGPRHFLPAIPFMVVFIAPLFTVRGIKLIAAPLIALSCFIMVLATAVEPRIPYEYRSPITEFLLPHFYRGGFSLQFWGVFSNRFMTSDSVAFNLGELFGLPPEWQLLPLAAVLLIGALLTSVTIKTEKALSNVVVLSGLGTVLALAIPVLKESQRLPVKGEGIQAAFYQGLVLPNPTETLPALVIARPALRRVERTLDLNLNGAELGLRTPFSAVFKGCMAVPAGGEYELSMESDDGAAVYIDRKLALSSWGEHPIHTESTRLQLAKGKHQLSVFYFNSLWGGRFKLTMNGQIVDQLNFDRELGCQNSSAQ